MEPIQSTAGAVAVLNEKGEVSMQKVKVHRYVSGKRPEYAPASSSEEESEEEDFLEKQKQPSPPPIDDIEKLPESILAEDPRLRRLIITRHAEPSADEQDNVDEDEDEDEVEDRRIRRRRHIQEPEILEGSDNEEEDNRPVIGSSDEEDIEELSDTEIEKRRQSLKQKVLTLKEQQQIEILEKEDEHMYSGEESEDDSSEYEQYSDMEEEQGPRLKPIFVKKKDRMTILEREKELAKKKQNEIDQKKKIEERRRQTLKLVEEEIKKEQAANKGTEEGCIGDVNTDDENDEVEYEAWKVRELKRIKRDRDEREQIERERLEIERLRNMTDEERKQELRMNPRLVTNKGIKGKYKFMQKYFHRGAFYLDEENQLFKRNFAAPTLDDHFEKTILPKVMQVKNFGRSGRTKYTHLVDQDTTHFDSPWISDSTQNTKFFCNQAAGIKQVFSRPSLKKHK